MKKGSLFLLAVLVSFTGFAQGIVFETGTWDEALAKAKETGRPVFVDVYTTWCGPCKRMSNDVFPQKSVGDVYNANFVCYKLDAEKGEGPALSEKYTVKGYPTYLFLRADGTVFYRFMGSCAAEQFLRITQSAIDEFKDPKTIADWDAEFATHSTDTAFIRSYIQKRAILEIPSLNLLEQYIRLQPAESKPSANLTELYLNQIEYIRVGSLAFDYLLQHPEIISSKNPTYLNPVLEDILQNSIRVAASGKDLTKLDDVLSACKKINALGSSMSQDDIYLSYYRFSGNQAKYNEYLFARSEKEAKLTFQDSAQLNKKPVVANNLNEHAWSIFLTIANKDTLQQALRWSTRAVELAPQAYTYLDTKACLLYKLGKRKDAIVLEEKVVAMIPKSSADYERYNAVVKQMKARERIWEKK